MFLALVPPRKSNSALAPSGLSDKASAEAGSELEFLPAPPMSAFSSYLEQLAGRADVNYPASQPTNLSQISGYSRSHFFM